MLTETYKREHCKITDKGNVNCKASHYEQATHNKLIGLSHTYIKGHSTRKKELVTGLYSGNIGFEFKLFDNKAINILSSSSW